MLVLSIFLFSHMTALPPYDLSGDETYLSESEMVLKVTLPSTTKRLVTGMWLKADPALHLQKFFASIDDDRWLSQWLEIDKSNTNLRQILRFRSAVATDELFLRNMTADWSKLGTSTDLQIEAYGCLYNDESRYLLR